MTRAGGTGRAAGTGMASVESSGTTPRRASASNPADFDRNHESHRSDEAQVHREGLRPGRDAGGRGSGVVRPAQSGVRDPAGCYPEHEPGPGPIGFRGAVTGRQADLELAQLGDDSLCSQEESGEEEPAAERSRHTPSFATRATRRWSSPTGGSSRSSVA